MPKGDLPFDVGKTFYDGGSIDSANLGGQHLEGKEYWVEDNNPSDNTSRSGRLRKLRIVRNVSGVALLPKYLVQFDTTAGKFGQQVSGYSGTDNMKAYPVDEYLASAGVPDDDLFYIVCEGPAMCVTSLTGDAQNNFAVGDHMVAATGAGTTAATTAGRIEQIPTGAATDVLRDSVANRVGVALTARTTDNTDTDTLIDVGKW
jgi:hypothetical protein